MKRWELLETFMHVVECGSLTAAAERLDVSRSLVSRHISRLESHLGTQLLFRTTRQVNPTDAGQELFLRCERLFGELEEAELSVTNRRELPKGHLRIVCTDILGEQYVARAAARFCSMHPQLRADVHITMRTVDLVAEGYDIAVRYGRLGESSLRARKVMELPHVVCASPAYLAEFGTPETIEDLHNHNCLVATFDPCTPWYFRDERGQVRVDLAGNWRSNNGSSLMTAALEGIGICRLPELYVRPLLRCGALVPLLEAYRAEPMPVWMVYPGTRHVPAKVRLFIDYFVEHAAALEAEVCASGPCPAVPGQRLPGR